MNLNQRRALSSESDPLNKFRKSDVVHMLTENGWDLNKGPTVNKGEWNQHHDWMATKEGHQDILVARQSKGERLDWDEIGRELMDKV